MKFLVFEVRILQIAKPFYKIQQAIIETNTPLETLQMERFKNEMKINIYFSICVSADIFPFAVFRKECYHHLRH